MVAHTDLDISAELRSVAFFTELTKDALSDLASVCVQRRVHAGVTLMQQGEPSLSLFVLVRGAAKLLRLAQLEVASCEVVLDVMRAPSLWVDQSLIDGHPAASSLITLRSSHLLAVERRHVMRLSAQHPTFARAVMAKLAREGRGLIRRIDQIAVGPVDERVRHLLESLAAQHGTPLGQGRFIAIPLRRKDLALMVNATTETVSRLLAKFEREGQARSTRDGIWWRAMRTPAPPASAIELTLKSAAELDQAPAIEAEAPRDAATKA